MTTKSIDFKLAKAIETFEFSFKNTLNNYDFDPKLEEALYLLGADIKHALDDFAEIIVENSQN